MSRDEAARVALRRLAGDTDLAHRSGQTATETADRSPPAGGDSPSNGDPLSESRSAESGANAGRPADSAVEGAADVVARAVAAVGDLDEAARFASEGSVETLAAALTDRSRPGSDAVADEGADALRAFCAFERAAARGRTDRSEFAAESAGSGAGTADDARAGTVTDPDRGCDEDHETPPSASTFAAESPHL